MFGHAKRVVAWWPIFVSEEGRVSTDTPPGNDQIRERTPSPVLTNLLPPEQLVERRDGGAACGEGGEDGSRPAGHLREGQGTNEERDQESADENDAPPQGESVGRLTGGGHSSSPSRESVRDQRAR